MSGFAMPCKDQPSKDPTGIPPSIHMHLGRGLSSLVRSRHTSCFDIDALRDEHVEQLRPSFSESDLESELKLEQE